MNKFYQRGPKQNNRTSVTTRRVSELLPVVLSEIGKVYHQRSDLILASWPDMIGPSLASMTQAVSFVDGRLVVKVKNSTLYSLLSQNEKLRILDLLRQKFPNVDIKTLYFRMG
jgi:hypothetical protein